MRILSQLRNRIHVLSQDEKYTSISFFNHRINISTNMFCLLEKYFKLIIIWKDELRYFILLNSDKDHHNVKVLSILETIEQMKTKSCIRFGDGEFVCASGGEIYYQNSNMNLSKRLKEIMLSETHPNVMLCFPDIFNININNYWNVNAKLFWSGYRIRMYSRLKECTVPNESYGNAHATRPYIDSNNRERKRHVPTYYTHLKQIWNGKNILIIEGKYTRNDFGNDLFSDALSIQRIVCPPFNAYDRYSEILSAALSVDKDKLILISLGPAGKILSWDLANAGYHVLDVGHIDGDYEWYLHHATGKEKYNNNKHCPEFEDGDIPELTDNSYLNQIILEIK